MTNMAFSETDASVAVLLWERTMEALLNPTTGILSPAISFWVSPFVLFWLHRIYFYVS